MAELPLNDRLSGPFVASAGQTDFPADFPVIKTAAVRVERRRAGVTTVLGPPDVSAVALTDDGFTARLATGAQAGDIIHVYTDLPPERLRAHVQNGAVRTATLEGDAVDSAALVQELRRDVARAMTVRFGETPPVLPGAAERAGKVIRYDDDGNAVAVFLADAGPFAPVSPFAADFLLSPDSDDARAAIGAVSVVFQRAAAGSVQRQLLDKINEIVSIRDFGGIDDGVTNNDAAFTAAIASLPPQGGTIVFPVVQGLGYGLTDVTIDKPVKVVLDGGYFNGARFLALNPTGDIIKTTTFGVHFPSFRFAAKAGVTRISGAYLKVDAPYIQIDGGQVLGHYIGLDLSGATLSSVNNVNFRSPTPHSVAQDGGHVIVGKRSRCIALLLHNLTADTEFSTGPLQPDGQPTSGIQVFDADALIVLACDLVRSGIGLNRTPGNGQVVTASFFIGSYFDNGRVAIQDAPTGTGLIFRNYHSVIWACSSTNRGINQSGTANNIFGNYYSYILAHLNGSDGVGMNGGVSELTYDAVSAAQNAGAGMSVNGARVRTRNCNLGAYDGLSGNAFGMFVQTGATDYDAVDNSLEGNTRAAWADGAMHAGRKVRGNRGYRTKNNGTATMAAAATTVTVPTLMSEAVPLGLINVTPPLSIGSATKWAVQNSIVGSFDIVFDIAPGSDIALPWSASVETI